MKARRQAKILELIKNHAIETQEELAARLTREGIPVTQATISRDIKELHLRKVPAGNGRYRYALPDDGTPGSWDKRRRILQESVLSVDHSENIIVIRALQGTAPTVAYAIDHLAWKEVIGTVAGEDTVLAIVRPKEAAPEVVERFRALIR
ncbi:arginine repressor [Caldinitratiruptor microaerophilus]|nr:arginine repressor [Caldinitratiruptor microaerophilus]